MVYYFSAFLVNNKYKNLVFFVLFKTLALRPIRVAGVFSVGKAPALKIA
tara:strand:+ start:664 stop:810 length:147 start_codon:yes stop_codon:yes gene_type:complete